MPDRREKITSRGSYSADEEKAILDAARKTVQAAAARICKARDVLERWRRGEVTQEGDPDLFEYSSILDMVESGRELPRNKWDNGTAPWIARHGTVQELMKQLHLTVQETAAITILLVRLTGENGSTIIKAPAAFHRTDGGAGPVSTVQIDLSKPRRGRRRWPPWSASSLRPAAARPRSALQRTLPGSSLEVSRDAPSATTGSASASTRSGSVPSRTVPPRCSPSPPKCPPRSSPGCSGSPSKWPSSGNFPILVSSRRRRLTQPAC